MYLTMDIGNTAVKWAAFEGDRLADSGYGMPEALIADADRVMACASGGDDALEQLATLRPDFEVLRAPYDTLPIDLDYKTPSTLGADRVAAACGAWSLHPAEASLIIDAGTCITVDYLDADGTYHGGAIMPGLGMSLQALNTFTAKLPLIELGADTAPRIPGRTTEESIVAGTLGATLLALAGYVTIYRQRSPQLNVVVTGGDAARLMTGATSGWPQQPHLTLIGLNEIMTHYEK